MNEPKRPPCSILAQKVTCQECVDVLLEYVDGLLSPEQQFQFESHLAFCPDCETFVANYRKASKLAGQAGDSLRAAATEPLPAALADAILKARKAKGGA